MQVKLAKPLMQVDCCEHRSSFAANWFESIARVMGSQIVQFSNEWTGTRDHQKWMEGISSLPALDQFQEIDPMESYVSVEEHQRYLSADREYAECFSAGIA